MKTRKRPPLDIEVSTFAELNAELSAAGLPVCGDWLSAAEAVAVMRARKAKQL